MLLKSLSARGSQAAALRFDTGETPGLLCQSLGLVEVDDGRGVARRHDDCWMRPPCAGLLVLLWLCHGVAAMDVVQVAVQPLRVQLRSGQSVTIFEVVNQDDALDAAIADDSDPFGAVCWPAFLC